MSDEDFAVVLAYREELRARRNRFITESAAAEYDEADDDEMAGLLEQARRQK